MAAPPNPPESSAPLDTPFQTEYLCICSGDDSRISSLTETAADRTGAAMLKAYRSRMRGRACSQAANGSPTSATFSFLTLTSPMRTGGLATSTALSEE